MNNSLRNALHVVRIFNMINYFPCLLYFDNVYAVSADKKTIHRLGTRHTIINISGSDHSFKLAGPSVGCLRSHFCCCFDSVGVCLFSPRAGGNYQKTL